MAASSSAKRKRNYSVAFKLQVVESAEGTTNREASRKFGVDEKRVREWKLQKDRLEDTDSKKRRLVGGGRKAKYPDIEEALASYIEGLRSRNLRVTTKAIQRKALELSHSSTPAEPGSSSNKPFAASRGWLCNFMKRWGFSLRRRTTVGQRLPPQLTDKVVSFIMKARKLRFKYNYELLAIGNMDETPCWMDMAGNTTVTQTGA